MKFLLEFLNNMAGCIAAERSCIIAVLRIVLSRNASSEA